MCEASGAIAAWVFIRERLQTDARYTSLDGLAMELRLRFDA